MKIGIDARLLGPEQGGIGRYIQELIMYLEELETNDDFVIFLRRENWEHFEPAAPNFKKVLAPYHWYGLAEQLFFPRLLKRHRLDLVHFPHWNAPLAYNRPFITTIHDLLLLEYPTREASLLGPVTYALKFAAYKKVLRHAALGARHIIAPSEFTKSDIVSKLSVKAEKISVVYPAPFNAEASSVSLSESDPELLRRFNITKPYVLYVGNAYPHKNLPRLLEAWEIFQKKYTPYYQLVLAGKKDFFYKKLERLAANRSTDVIFTNFVSDEELMALYRRASLYVFPSLYEGFGLPPLEALSQGLPVVSSNAACLPEILGDGALYFDPRNSESLAEAIYHGLTNREVRQNLLIAGKTLLLKYAWRAAAEKTYALYKKWAG